MSARPDAQTAIDQEQPYPDTAAEWFARMQGVRSAADEKAFDLWLAGDPGRATAYRALEVRWAQLGLSATDPRALALKASTLARLSRRQSGSHKRAAALAIATVGLVAAGGAWWWTGLSVQTYQTGPGERLNVALEDRSRVDMAPMSRLRVRYQGGERRLYLDHGQAYFIVAHDPRPFRVQAGDRIVTATGTQFQVRVVGRQSEVLLVEGSVVVDAVRAGSAHRHVLGPRQSLTGSLDQARPVSGDVEVETAWRVGRLVFRERPLAEVITELNRWSAVQIELVDPSIANLPVSGSFRYDGADDFVTALEKSFGLDVETTSDGRFLVRKAAQPRRM